jgi:Na+-transporting NADH:ubiquinone oxidoreductase subunit B
LKLIEKFFDLQRPLFEKGGKLEKLYPAFEAGETFLLTPSTVTRTGPHIRDPIDLKRVMIMVVISLIPCTVFGMYNAGYQALRAEGAGLDFLDCMTRGAYLVLPIIITSYAVGGTWEALFSIVRRHEINEGFLVTGILFPLTLPPDIPLWMVAAGISFGVVIGKEIFGGTGMNILNPALTARAFVFFAYPAHISGDRVWTALPQDAGHLVDGYSGATALLIPHQAEAGSNAVQALLNVSYNDFSWMNMFLGFIPGSIGETSTLCCLIGAVFLILTGIGSWRIMAAVCVGMTAMASFLNFMATETSGAAMTLPAWYHLVMGGFAFGTVFMATDPVSAAITNKGKWVYGILIGVLIVLIRVVNPAYPEGVMLAILFMNIFAPLIDHYVVKANIRRRELRYATT